MLDELDLPPRADYPRWIDAPDSNPPTVEPPNIRREGLWVIEDEDRVWDAPQPGLLN